VGPITRNDYAMVEAIYNEIAFQAKFGMIIVSCVVQSTTKET